MKNYYNQLPKSLMLITIIFVGLMFFGTSNAQAQKSKLIGDWKLSKTSDSSDTRSVSFKMSGNNITGSYTNAAGEQFNITSINFSGGTYRFKIGGLSMNVSLKSENDNLFKGKARVSGEKLWDNVQMVRRD